MMLKTAVVVLVVLLASVSTAKKPEDPAPLECAGWSEVVVKSGSCDGTCENAQPACLFTKILKDRCGCPPGKVRDESANCIKVWRCPNRENLPTQCQHASLLNSQFKCDENGLFQRKQTVDGVTKCVVPETGSTIPGTTNSKGGDVDCSVDAMSPCQRADEEVSLFHYNNPFVMDGPAVYCSSAGNYRRRQCVSFTSSCRCVIPRTGTAIPGLEFVGPRFKCKSVKYTKCQEEFIAADLLNHETDSNTPLPICSAIDGKYAASECDAFGICQCRDRDSGKYLPGRGANMNCAELTSCQKQYTSGMAEEDMKGCDDDGRYSAIQCADGWCWCVDPDTGADVEGVDRVPISESRDLECPKPQCDGGMEYMTCAGCDTTCENKDQLFMCTMMCRSKCACPGSLVWNKQEKACVERDSCPTLEIRETDEGFPGLGDILLISPPDLIEIRPPPLPEMPEPAVLPAMAEPAVMPGIVMPAVPGN